MWSGRNNNTNNNTIKILSENRVVVRVQAVKELFDGILRFAAALFDAVTIHSPIVQTDEQIIEKIKTLSDEILIHQRDAQNYQRQTVILTGDESVTANKHLREANEHLKTLIGIRRNYSKIMEKRSLRFNK
jgi:hypothetical protein